MSDVKISDIVLSIDGSQPNIKFGIKAENAVSNGKPYEPEITDIFCRWLRPGDTVIDVGANVGWFTLLAASIVGPSGSVHAFEPGPDNLKLLDENVQLNEFKNITISGNPLSDEATMRDFYLNPKGHGGHSLWKMMPEATPLNLQTKTLDQCLFKNKIRILKIDTEGHEQRILMGAAKLLQSGQAPEFIFAEYHHQGLAAEGDTEHSMRMFMEAHGYYCFLLPPHSFLPIQLPARVVMRSQYAINYLFVREAQLSELPQFIEIGTLEIN